MIKTTVYSPLSGKIILPDNTQELIFSNRKLVSGIAIDPSDGNICSPFDGEIWAVFPTGHIIGIRDVHGCEVLIHIGKNMVELAGMYFEILCQIGQKVSAGDIIVKFDLKAINKAGYSIVVHIVVVKNEFLDNIEVLANGTVNAGRKLIEVSSKL
ncbi:MAG: PTS glucose transporter subunit IIA [Firmicutes bacterium]|nr:PTS glucose transporter subunit IIA [Bacillota bacterium]